MAKTTVPRHSKTARKPVTIDLDPSDVKPLKPMPDEKTGPDKTSASDKNLGPDKKVLPAAEPVGDFTQTKKLDMKPVEVAAPTPPPTAKSEPDAKLQNTARPAAPAGVSGSNSYTTGKTMNSGTNSAGGAGTSSKTTSPWVAGIVGGVMALLGATALQLSGFGPFSTKTNNNNEAEQALSAQVAKLEQQLSLLQNAPAPKPDADLLSRLEAAEKNAAEAQKLISELPQVTQPPVGAAGNDDALREELTQRLNALETKLATTSTQAEQASAALSGDNDTVKALKEQLATLQSKIENQASQPDMAVIIAVNALKSAIDRGSSYTNELQTYVSLQPHNAEAVANLENLAQVGVPTLSQLNTQFSTLAYQMVAAENKPAADAGIWDQLVGSAKGLVRSRPVGDVTGADAGAVAARVEFALQNGDTERAITEWAQLPEAAKQVGQNFYNALLARRDAESLMAKLIAQTAQPTPANTPKPAAQ